MRFTKSLKENRNSETETLQGKVESIYVNDTTRCQASVTLRKLRMSPKVYIGMPDVLTMDRGT
jgi:hypothetical protein